MIQVKVGQMLDCTNARFGMRQDGKPWGLTEVKAEKGYDKLTVWFTNPDVAKGRTQVEVIAISSAKMSNRRYTAKDGQEKWVTDYSVDATVKAAGAQQVPQNNKPNFDSYMNDFVDLSKVEDTGLPFN